MADGCSALAPSEPVDEVDDSAEWLCELVGFEFTAPAMSVPVDDSAEWLQELVGFSVLAPSVQQVDDSTE